MEPIIQDKIAKAQLRWFRHVRRMPVERIVYETRVQGKNKKGRPKTGWNDEIREADKKEISWENIIKDRK